MHHVRTTQSVQDPDLNSSLGALSDTETFDIGDFTDNSSAQEDLPNINATGVDSSNILDNVAKSSTWHSGLAPPDMKRKYCRKPKMNCQMIE